MSLGQSSIHSCIQTSTRPAATERTPLNRLPRINLITRNYTGQTDYDYYELQCQRLWLAFTSALHSKFLVVWHFIHKFLRHASAHCDSTQCVMSDLWPVANSIAGESSNRMPSQCLHPVHAGTSIHTDRGHRTS